ncbi:MAG: protein-glutamate O-methyltransferase CheR [bacterium]|nr:protein-glutamate O-methyltransferase CheR [bacterium]
MWSAACATGEEPYSVAILLLEMLGPKIDSWKVNIIATDIDIKALNRAEEGAFTLKQVEGIQPALLKNYFVQENNSFSVKPEVRQLVTFKVHNLAGDPPYQDLDLVICRNVIIYFISTLQSRMLTGFHEGLKKGGFLLLGKAEVLIGEMRRMFECLDIKAKLYRKIAECGM